MTDCFQGNSVASLFVGKTFHPLLAKGEFHDQKDNVGKKNVTNYVILLLIPILILLLIVTKNTIYTP
jgi:hypothetical protein